MALPRPDRRRRRRRRRSGSSCSGSRSSASRAAAPERELRESCSRGSSSSLSQRRDSFRPGRDLSGCPWSATWTVEPCDPPSVAALAAALERLARRVASVLVRRGLGDPEAARRVPRPRATAHDPFLLGDMAAAVERIRAAVDARQADLRPRRLRRRRHLRDRARRARPCASSAPTSTGTCRAASRRATASRRETLARLAEDGSGSS